MEKIKNWVSKYGHYFVPALLTLAIMLISFLIKGVHPFGNGYTGIIDYDLGLVPSYTHLWDFIHGESSFIFNETLGMGSNIYASSVLNTFFSPISYLVGLSSREGVRFFIGYIVVIKMMLMATTSYVIFNKWFKNVDKKTLCVFSLLWTFSSWLLVHISNVGWLDVMIIFPFLIESLKVLIEKGKISYFVAMLTLCLIFSYYMSYMILIMLVIGTICVNRTLVENKQDKKRIIGQLFVGILFALFLSMFAFLPSFMQTQASYRFTDEVAKTEGNYFYTKIIMVLFYGILIYLPFMLFKNHKEDKNVKFFTLFSILTLLPVIIEPINKMWHTGSYFSYPFRFSYIPIFFLILACLYYFNTYFDKDIEKEESKKKYLKEIFILISVLALVFYLIAIVADIYISLHLAFAQTLLSLIIYVVPLILTIVLICIGMKLFKKEYRKSMLLIVSIIQIVIHAIGYMGYTPSNNVDRIYQIKDEFDIDSLDKNYAIKDETRSLMSNFPLIMDHKSISTWLHINGQYQNLNAIALGYGNASTQIRSYGGTVFSDMLSNTRYVLSYEVLSDSLYNLLEKNTITIDNEDKEVYLYEYKYNLPLGLVVSKDLQLIDIDNKENAFYNQNKIYRELFNKTEDLIDVDTYKRVTIKEISVSASDEAVYLYLSDTDLADAKVYVNNKEMDYLVDNGIINLGVYNETITIKIENEEEIEVVEVATIKVSNIATLASENTNEVKVEYKDEQVIVNVNSNKEGKLYIPINYENDSWSATNNDKVVEVNRFLQSYLCVEVNEGENNIVLTFTPQKSDLGLKLTLITLVLVAILFAINIKFKFFNKKGVVVVTYILGAVIGVAIGAYIYLIPLTR